VVPIIEAIRLRHNQPARCLQDRLAETLGTNGVQRLYKISDDLNDTLSSSAKQAKLAATIKAATEQGWIPFVTAVSAELAGAASYLARSAAKGAPVGARAAKQVVTHTYNPQTRNAEPVGKSRFVADNGLSQVPWAGNQKSLRLTIPPGISYPKPFLLGATASLRAYALT